MGGKAGKEGPDLKGWVVLGKEYWCVQTLERVSLRSFCEEPTESVMRPSPLALTLLLSYVICHPNLKQPRGKGGLFGLQFQIAVHH